MRDRTKDKEIGNYRVRNLPYFRRIFVDTLEVMAPSANMLAQVELDVTDARRIVREHAREGVCLSFQAFLIKSIAAAINEFKDLNSVQWGYRQVIFEDVDFNIPLELTLDGEVYPRQIVIRKTNEKSAEDIYQEIEEAKRLFAEQSVTGSEDQWALRLMKGLFLLPAGIRKMILRRMVQNPFLVKKRHGTIHYTSVAGFGQYPISVIPCMIGTRAVDFTIAGICRKPTKVQEEMELREILSMTLMFNHALIDGAPAGRFTNRLRKIIEQAEILKP